MVKRQKRDSTETPVNKEENEQQLEARKSSASTPYETCSEPLSAFGGVLALIKFLDLIQFEQLFDNKSQPQHIGIGKRGHSKSD